MFLLMPFIALSPKIPMWPTHVVSYSVFDVTYRIDRRYHTLNYITINMGVWL